MARKKVLSLRCPTCKTIVLRDAEHFPFCSARCRLIDLGKWASGAYRISSPVMDPELLEEIEPGSTPQANTKDERGRK